MQVRTFCALPCQGDRFALFERRLNAIENQFLSDPVQGRLQISLRAWIVGEVVLLDLPFSCDERMPAFWTKAIGSPAACDRGHVDQHAILQRKRKFWGLERFLHFGEMWASRLVLRRRP